MFIGHVVGAEILHELAPGVSWAVLLAGSAFPDLFWGTNVLLNKEQVEVDPNSRLQKDVKFTNYPYSHSLVLGTLFACIPGLFLGYFLGWQAGVLFVVASALHWLFDVLVHLKDLPVLGFGRDIKVGFGLWKYARTAFVAEYAFFALFTLLLTPRVVWVPALLVGIFFHSTSANPFFGIGKGNMFKTAKQYGFAALFGFTALILVFTYILNLSA